VTDRGPESHLDPELLAAQLRRHNDDLSLYAGFLLNVLAGALPPELVRVTREGRWKARISGREPAVLGISVLLGNERYELERAEPARLPTARIRHESGGVVLSTRTVSADEWSRGLATALVRLAGTNAAAVAALHRLTTG
jgi:hypothetical protein